MRNLVVFVAVGALVLIAGSAVWTFRAHQASSAADSGARPAYIQAVDRLQHLHAFTMHETVTTRLVHAGFTVQSTTQRYTLSHRHPASTRVYEHRVGDMDRGYAEMFQSGTTHCISAIDVTTPGQPLVTSWFCSRTPPLSLSAFVDAFLLNGMGNLLYTANRTQASVRGHLRPVTQILIDGRPSLLRGHGNRVQSPCHHQPGPARTSFHGVLTVDSRSGLPLTFSSLLKETGSVTVRTVARFSRGGATWTIPAGQSVRPNTWGGSWPWPWCG